MPIELPETAAASFEDALQFVREQGGDLALSSGEKRIDHALGTAHIIQSLRGDHPAQLAALLFIVTEYVRNPEKTLTERFGRETAQLALDVRKLLQLGLVSARMEAFAQPERRDAAAVRQIQIEALRKMLLAFAQDIRVMLIRLASRLQTLRFHAASKTEPRAGVPQETLDIYAPLVNRLGIWQLKWELEDLAFRFLQPDTYKKIAKLLDERRVERESYLATAIEQLRGGLAAGGIDAEVSGRPKHIYSIWRKMQNKQLDFSELYDVLALRVIVPDVKDCYAALSVAYDLWQPVSKEYDDYISRPKPNGYQSLHTVVTAGQRSFEIQIRTRQMHHFAEYGIAAHWRYKEAGTRGGTQTAQGDYDEKIAWLRQLLAWKDEAGVSGVVSDPEADSADAREKAGAAWQQLKSIAPDDHIYVLTPQARVIALPQGATPVDFAYHLHTDLGHRCRGARVDGVMVPLQTPLQNGQTVEIIACKPGLSPTQGGPSRDWLNPQLGYLRSTRARTKVRAWFNALDQHETVAQGRALVEKILQREGKTAIKLDELATRLGFKTADELFIQAGKDELSLRRIQRAVKEGGKGEPSLGVAEPASEPYTVAPNHAASHNNFAAASSRQSADLSGARTNRGSVLVGGVGVLLTQLARCCRPAPPDEIAGFVTRGNGVSIHRSNCPNLLHLAQRMPERVLQTDWSADALSHVSPYSYPVEILIEGQDRSGLLRDVLEVFAREKMATMGARMVRSKSDDVLIRLTTTVPNSAQVQRVCTLLGEVAGVTHAQRAN